MKNNSQIREAAAMLQEQEEVLSLCLAQFRSLQSVLTEQPTGRGVLEAAEAIEPLLARFSALVERQREFLADKGTARMTRYIVQQGASRERDAALRLVKRVAEQEKLLRAASAEAKLLLQRSRDFAVFTINVMTAVRANDTYAPPGAAEAEHARGIKMFEANV